MRLDTKRIAVIVLGAGIYLAGQWSRGEWFPSGPNNDTLGWPLILAGIALFIAGIMLLFSSERGWSMWRKFNIVFLPVFAIALFFTYQYMQEHHSVDIGVLPTNYAIITLPFAFLIYVPVTLLLVVLGLPSRKDTKS